MSCPAAKGDKSIDESTKLKLLGKKQRVKAYMKDKATAEEQIMSRHSMPVDIARLMKEQDDYQYAGAPKKQRYSSIAKPEDTTEYADYTKMSQQDPETGGGMDVVKMSTNLLRDE